MLKSSGKVVVTGGAGFIGSHLVDRLLEDGVEVVVFDNFSSGRQANLARHRTDPCLQLIVGDVRDARAVSEVLRGARTVYHLAAQSSPTDALKHVDVTFATKKLEDAAGRVLVDRAAVERDVFFAPVGVQRDDPGGG